MISKTCLKALKILKDTDYFKPMRPGQFALKMWPDSDMHTKVKNTGNGATTGKGAWLCGGSYLSKLQKKGLVHQIDFQYYISYEGKQELKNRI